jgi:hypothetical protein
MILTQPIMRKIDRAVLDVLKFILEYMPIKNKIKINIKKDINPNLNQFIDDLLELFIKHKDAVFYIMRLYVYSCIFVFIITKLLVITYIYTDNESLLFLNITTFMLKTYHMWTKPIKKILSWLKVLLGLIRNEFKWNKVKNEPIGKEDSDWKKIHEKPLPAKDFNKKWSETRTEYSDNFNIKKYAQYQYLKDKDYISPTQNEINCFKRAFMASKIVAKSASEISSVSKGNLPLSKKGFELNTLSTAVMDDNLDPKNSLIAAKSLIKEIKRIPEEKREEFMKNVSEYPCFSATDLIKFNNLKKK